MLLMCQAGFVAVSGTICILGFYAVVWISSVSSMSSAALAIEKALHAALGPEAGEFYPILRYDEIKRFLFNVLEFVSAPCWTSLDLGGPRLWHARLRGDLRLCCGGRTGGFVTASHRARSMAVSGRRGSCPLCGKVLSLRSDHMRRHQMSSSCRRPLKRRRWRAGVIRPMQ